MLRKREGSVGVGDRASDSHFNDPGFESWFGHRNFSSIFHHFWNFGSIRTLDRRKHFSLSSVWMTDLLNSALPWDACLRVWMCEWMWLSFESGMLLSGTLAWYGREEEGVWPPSLNHTCLSLEIWWNMGKLVFPGEWRLYVKSLQLLMWSSFKVSCLGYQKFDMKWYIFTYCWIQFGTKYLPKSHAKIWSKFQTIHTNFL
jgi:hypothetical protein